MSATDTLPVATLPAEIIAAPTSSVNLAPPASGRITRWLVTPGETIVAHQALAELRSPQLSSVHTRVSTLEAKVRERRRAEALAIEAADRGITSIQDAQAATSALSQSVAALAAARAELASYGTTGTGGSFTWRAPISGVVGEIRCAVGSVRADQHCVSIQHDEKVLLQVRVPERYLALVTQPTTAQFVSLSGSTFSFIESNRSPSIDPRTRSVLFQYKASGPSPLQGSSGRAAIRTLISEGFHQIPVSALTRLDGKHTVFVRGDEGPEPRTVRVHGRDAEFAVVEGLEDATEVATTGVFLLKSVALLEEE